MEFLSHLNDAQKKAVTKTEGPLMILAGAGSGKTRTLVMRISYLIEEIKVSNHQILALTFSNKAAREMRERVAYEVGTETESLQITTFHSFCAKLLRNESSHIGLSRSFVIYDQSESRSIVKSIIQRHGISTKEISPYEVMAFMDEIKNNGLYAGRESAEREIDEQHDFYPFYVEYESELHRANAVDFGGLITGALQLFHKYPNVLERYQNRFKYILVDEYQDTNRAQFELIHLLAKKRKNVCVVGDEDQSIYSWRGADINNIFDFEKYFPETETLKLEQNYRSSKNIIEAASHVIAHNEIRKGKKMWTDNPQGKSIRIMECSSEKEEARFLAKEIKNLSKNSPDLSEIAIFYRANSQSRLIEDCLRTIKLPYRVVGGVKFYERKEIKDLLGYLKLVINPRDSLSLSRVINVPTRGIGATTLRKLEAESIQKNCSLWETIEHIIEQKKDYSHLKLSARIVSSLEEFATLIGDVRYLDREKLSRPSVLYEKILHESGYWQHLKARKDYETAARLENLQELLGAIKQYEEENKEASLSSFLEQIALDAPNDEVEAGGAKGEVSLMTVHAAKGLEFHYAFIVGAEENVFPSYRSLEESQDRVEEERRLFYVAMTRAMKELTICFAQGRMLFGQMKFNGPSRFIDEIPESFYRWEKCDSSITPSSFERPRWCEEEASQETLADVGEVVYQIKQPSKSPFKRGKGIRHSLYGKGKILSLEGSDGEEKVTILFNDGSRKKFMVKFAPLELL